jgi:hypothetical protein
MDGMNRSQFTPDDDWTPETLAGGQLGPPGRKPPTAVGAAAPRPPRRPYGSGRHRDSSTLRRVARVMLSVLFLATGVIAIALFEPIAGIVAGTGLTGLGAVVAIRLLRLRRYRRRIRLTLPVTGRRDRDSGSVARSA